MIVLTTMTGYMFISNTRTQNKIQGCGAGPPGALQTAPLKQDVKPQRMRSKSIKIIQIFMTTAKVMIKAARSMKMFIGLEAQQH